MTEKLYQYCASSTSLGDQYWKVVSQSGEVICEHISSSRSWGLRDTGPNGFYKAKYPDDYELVVLDHGVHPEYVERLWIDGRNA